MRALFVLLLSVAVCAISACARAAPATITAEVAVVGAESALGYASAIALGKGKVVAVHNTHSLTSLQLVRILHLRELGVTTLAVDFTDLGHVYHFNSSVNNASQAVLFADVEDEATEIGRAHV